MNDSLRDKLLNGVTNVAPINTRDLVVDVPRPAGAPQNAAKVMFCIPSGRSWESRTACSVAGMATFTALNGKSIGISNLEGSMITKSRNDLVQIAINANFDYIMWIDTDMVFPPDSLLKLLAHNKDIVGSTYNKRVPPYETLGRLKGEAPVDLLKGGLREAELLPGGFLLVKVDVYRKLRWPWYFETYQWQGENGVDALKNYLRDNFNAHAPEDLLATLDDSPLAAWLNDVHSKESANNPWRYFSEDVNFCRKAIKNGNRIWCDLNITFNMIHLGVLEVTCKPPQDAAPAVVVDAQM